MMKRHPIDEAMDMVKELRTTTLTTEAAIEMAKGVANGMCTDIHRIHRELYALIGEDLDNFMSGNMSADEWINKRTTILRKMIGA